MKGQGSYVPPPYIPLDQLDTEANSTPVNNGYSSHQSATRDLTQWSSGICACFDDMQSCCVGAVCPCFLFGKNAEFLGSGTLAGSCMTHFILWGLVNSLCCLFTGGLLAAVPGSMVACYACGYRKTLRAKFNLQDSYTCSEVRNNFWCARCFAGHGTEVMLNHMVVHIGEELRLEAPCGDLTTHLFCHLCAICQEYREIRERSSGSDPSMMSSAVAAPAVQTMELAPHE